MQTSLQAFILLTFGTSNSDVRKRGRSPREKKKRSFFEHNIMSKRKDTKFPKCRLLYKLLYCLLLELPTQV